MTTTGHAVTGALIATLVRQPLLAIPLAFASHFVCDALPHFGLGMKFGSKKMYYWLVIDGLVALCIAVFLIYIGVADPVLLAVCGFAAMSPDLAWLYYGLRGEHGDYKKYDWISRFHSKIQWYEKPQGILVDLVWSIVMVAGIVSLQ